MPVTEYDRDDGPSRYLVYSRGEGSVKIYLFGSQITSFLTSNIERTWISSLSVDDGTAPIRGEVPIAFPQFADEGELKLHGFARESTWAVKEQGDEGVVMELVGNEETRKIWPHSFRLEYTVKLSSSGTYLDLSLRVINSGSSPFTFSGCLHTYFRFDDTLKVQINGLGGAQFIDKCDSRKVKEQEEKIVTVVAESRRSVEDAGKEHKEGFVDRVYLNTRDQQYTMSCPDKLYTVTHRGFPDTTLYNPFTGDKQGPKFPDFDDEGCTKIICLEPTIGETNRVELQ